MQAAGREEKQHAIEQNSYHKGVSAISVIVDEGWSKSTQKHSYNALSGVGVIIGKHNGKLLYIGVRNKYCAACVNNNKTKVTMFTLKIGKRHQHQWSQISSWKALNWLNRNMVLGTLNSLEMEIVLSLLTCGKMSKSRGVT